MILYLLFQILISWMVTCCLLKIFNKALSISKNEFYQDPALFTGFLSAIDINLHQETKLKIGMVVHHIFGLCFAAIYYLIWYSEFSEISWMTTIIIGIVNALMGIISWAFLLEIIPAVHIRNFKGYYLQQVFVNHILIITAFFVNWLLQLCFL